MTRKEEVTTLDLELGMEVYHESIYHGEERMTVVGIRQNEVELRGDYSGGVRPVSGDSWLPIKGTFRLRKVCIEKAKPNGCQLHNIHCGYPDCEPFI